MKLYKSKYSVISAKDIESIPRIINDSFGEDMWAEMEYELSDFVELPMGEVLRIFAEDEGLFEKTAEKWIEFFGCKEDIIFEIEV